MQEEAPVNSVGAGQIAGIGIGPNGEPPMRQKAIGKYQRRNQKEAPKSLLSFATFLKRSMGEK